MVDRYGLRGLVWYGVHVVRNHLAITLCIRGLPHRRSAPHRDRSRAASSYVRVCLGDHMHVDCERTNTDECCAYEHATASTYSP